jgi:hypothetical protein
MAKKAKLGADPLAWVKDSRKDAETGELSPSLRKAVKRSKKKLEEIPSIKQGLPEGWTRATFILREEHLEKLRALAYWDRKEIKQVVDEALEKYLRGKKVKSKPEEGR